MTDLRTDTGYVRPPLRPGELVGARYRLERVAGAGGMATVWRGYDERLQRPVAIKVISDALATNPAAVARFAREARTHARIQHPNLVQVYDYSVTASQPYLVMEYIDGCTLSERLDRGGFSEPQVRALATELLSAIACVHDHGVLHRDIKTGNVLLDSAGHARLTDFGLARLEDATHITRANEVVGTLRFLAPELIEGRPATRQSDLYALGVLLRTVVADADGPPALQNLIRWMTQHDPEGRPSDAEVALGALRSPRRRDALRPAAAKPHPATDEEPTEPLRSDSRDRHSTSPQLRARTAAVTALLVTLAAVTFAVLGAGGRGQAMPRAATTATTRTGRAKLEHRGVARASTTGPIRRSVRDARTIDRQLQQLADSVRRAAGP